MTETLERRIFDQAVELRAAPDGSASPGTLTGYAAVFNSLSRDLGGWFEVIDPAAFGEIGDVDLVVHGRVIARTNHDSNLLLGTSNVGTLRMSIDEVGLRYEVDLPDTTYGRDLAVLADRGDIQYSSFAFLIPPEGSEWTYDENDRLVRRVLKALLRDVAPVADPAYWETPTELQRSAVDLDAVRNMLNPPEPPPGPPGDREAAFLARGAAFTVRKELA
jgi:HK97 family phage prohead protease